MGYIWDVIPCNDFILGRNQQGTFSDPGDHEVKVTGQGQVFKKKTKLIKTKQLAISWMRLGMLWD